MIPKVERKVNEELRIKIPYLCPYCGTEQERIVDIRYRPVKYRTNVWVHDFHARDCRTALILQNMRYLDEEEDCCWNCACGFITSHEDHDWVRCKLVVYESWEYNGKVTHSYAPVSPAGSCDFHERRGKK